MIEPACQKRRLRREIRQRILSIDPLDRARQQAELERLFLLLPGFETARTVLLYVSAFPEEVETRAMIRKTLDLGKRLIIPRVDPAEDRLRLHNVRDLATDLIPGHKGIPEPTSICTEVDVDEVDWILVPGLAFDDRGHRLGRGRGHYDRLLDPLRANLPRWALAFDVQRIANIPVEPHDRPIHGVLTTYGAREFSRDDSANLSDPAD